MRLLENGRGLTGTGVRQEHETLLERLKPAVDATGPEADWVGHFLRVTHSYWPGLFRCYDVPGLPRTNNNLEQFFGSWRYHERRIRGRKTGSTGVLVRGAAPLLAATATPTQALTAADLRPTSITDWRAFRSQLDQRHEARRKAYCFRRHPERYLSDLESRALKVILQT